MAHRTVWLRIVQKPGIVPLGDDAKVYAMIGPTNVEITASFEGFSPSADEDDTGIGFGYEKALGSTSSIAVEYILYNHSSGVGVDAFNISYINYF